jgi:hypothetical protein
MTRRTPSEEETEDGPGAGARLGALFTTPFGGVLRRLLIAAVVLLAISLVVRQARAAVQRMPAYRLGPEAVKFVDLGPAVDASMRQDVEDWLDDLFPSDVSARPSTYDVGVENRVREILGAHPMLRSLDEVEVRFPAEIRVKAQVRTPMARFRARIPGDAARGRTLEVPLDAEGHVLHPKTYADFLRRYRTVLVVGVESICPDVGRRWTDTREQVAEGLAAARVANRLNDDLAVYGAPKVEIVDVSAFPAPPRERGKGEVVLRLADGRQVQWGRTERSLADVTLEDGYEAKRDRLIDLLRSPTAPRTLDVRFRSPPRRATPAEPAR